MARMASTRLGFQWHDYVQADAECDRYWAFKKLNVVHYMKPQKIAKSGTSRREEDKRKIYIDF